MKNRAVHVVYNDSEGAFSLSRSALEWLSDRGVNTAYKIMKELEKFSAKDTLIDETMIGLKRHSPILVLCVSELGELSSGNTANLRVTKIKSKKYIIRNTGGIETVLTPDDIVWTEVD